MIKLPTEKTCDIFTHYGIQIAYLFGSQSQGNPGPLSDVDIAVLFPSDVKPSERFSKHLFLLHDILHLLETSNLDLVILNDAPIAICFNVIREGKILFSQNRPLQVRFEETVIRDYLDTEFLRQTYNRALFKNIAEGLLQ